MLAVVVGLGVVALGVYALGVALVLRSWHRAQANYHHESARLCREHERKLRDVAERLRGGADAADEAFRLLRLGMLANNSREVSAWEDRPASPERTEVAWKWVAYTVAESAAEAARHEIWARPRTAPVAAFHPIQRGPRPRPTCRVD